MNAAYFLHIPKTAGTSVTTLLRQEYGARLCPYQLWDQIAELAPGALATYDAFAGHFGMNFVEYIHRPLRTFTFLREPIARTISHYLHVKRDPNHPYFDVVQDIDLRAFLLHPITQPLVYNFQARQLANQALSPEDYLSRIRPATFVKGYLAVTWEAAGYYRSEGEIRSCAFEALAALDYVGLTDQIDECILELAILFGFSNNTVARENISPNRDIVPKLDKGLISLINALTEIDQELYGSVLKKRAGLRGRPEILRVCPGTSSWITKFSEREAD